MALRNIGEKDFSAAPPDGGGKALIFVLNAKYLGCFRVMIYSLLRQSSFLDLPVIVVTDEEEVFRDPVVTAIVDVRRLVTEADKAMLASVLNRKIKDKYRLDWIAKYTFLKWLIFDDYGYDRLLYIDADMLMLKPLDDMFDAAPDADIVACPRFPEELIDRETPEENAAGLQAFVEVAHNPYEVCLNSGIMVLGRRTLSSAFRDGLVDLASQQAFASEQRAVWQHSRDSGLSLTYLSPNYNFKSMCIDRILISDQMKYLSDIRVLHYIGSSKPWTKADDAPLTYNLWRRFAREAEAFFASGEAAGGAERQAEPSQEGERLGA